jgi:hypothetical protein
LKNQAGIVQAIVMAVPFLRPSDVPLVQNAADPYLDGVRELYRLTTEAADAYRAQHNPNAALIALGHCHLQGGEESRESERRLVIGGAEAIGPDDVRRADRVCCPWASASRAAVRRRPHSLQRQSDSVVICRSQLQTSDPEADV